MKPTLPSAISAYGREAKAKLSSETVQGEPEDQLRGPLENLLQALAHLIGLKDGDVAAVGESAIVELKTRPDYAVTVKGVLVGFIEVKAPGKSADPRKYKGHDKGQWDKLQSLPNLIYTDGNEFSLWHSGQISGSIVRLIGDVESSGEKLAAPEELLNVFEGFLRWEPIPPRSAKELAKTSARLCRLLRSEVAEQLGQKSPVLTDLAKDWRKLLFPEANDEQFADGYAQAVTFGLLMARAKGIFLGAGLEGVARQIGKTNSLIGAALRILTDDAENRDTLKTSLGTLARVLDTVDWPTLSKGDPDAWLYFYEDFLEVYDNDLRKKTGSYYTPPQVVDAMVRLVDDVLRSSRFGLHGGFASPAVTVVDPAVGTGTFPLGIIRRIAGFIAEDQGEGAVFTAVEDAVARMIAFEIQLGPFAVAQLRIFAELLLLKGWMPKVLPRMFVTDTLGNPYAEQDALGSMYAPIAESRRLANKIKREERVTVVIGNPPYKEKAKGRGGWIEKGSPGTDRQPPLNDWQPPREWGVGAHAKHLRNLYIYFWRWATWKVFDLEPKHNTGVVCFITVAGFLNGPGFQKMRDYLRRTADAIWVIDCSPEGHQPDVPTRIFQGVQQPVCIVLVSRSAASDPETPAVVKYRALPEGKRDAKFEALERLTLESDGWIDCPTEWRAGFLPATSGAWSTYPALEDLFAYNGCGVQPKRVWVIAPDKPSLMQRWQRLIDAPIEKKEELFHATLRGGLPADRHIRSVVNQALPGFEVRITPIINEKEPCAKPVQYGFRSFDRQWIIPDPRVITQPNADLWRSYSKHQVFVTAPSDRSPENGPALSFASIIPDLHHYNGRGGRVFPLYRDKSASVPNLPLNLIPFLAKKYKAEVSAEDWLAYIASVAANPAYTARFQGDLTQPGLRIPVTAKAALFREAVEIGRTVVWLHTYGERCIDARAGRPVGSPRLPKEEAPKIARNGAIPGDTDSLTYNAAKRQLLVGTGVVENVPPEVWAYEVSGKEIVKQWFSYRRKNRERPIIGDRRKPSPLGDIQPDHWLAEYTTELINLLNILGCLVKLEPKQADLLERICKAPTITVDELKPALEVSPERRKKLTDPGGATLLDGVDD